MCHSNQSIIDVLMLQGGQKAVTLPDNANIAAVVLPVERSV